MPSLDRTARDGRLGTLGGPGSEALGISQTGVVVGISETAAGTAEAYTWTRRAGDAEPGYAGRSGSPCFAAEPPAGRRLEPLLADGQDAQPIVWTPGRVCGACLNWAEASGSPGPERVRRDCSGVFHRRGECARSSGPRRLARCSPRPPGPGIRRGQNRRTRERPEPSPAALWRPGWRARQLVARSGAEDMGVLRPMILASSTGGELTAYWLGLSLPLPATGYRPTPGAGHVGVAHDKQKVGRRLRRSCRSARGTSGGVRSRLNAGALHVPSFRADSDRVSSRPVSGSWV